MEVFGAAGAAIQLADIALRLFQNLCEFVNNVKTADTAAKELRDKVESLWTTVNHVNLVIDAREKTGRPLTVEEKRIRKALAKDISVSKRVLEQFEKSIEGLLRNPAQPVWLGKTLIQLQLEKRDAAIRRLENFIDTRLQMMQVSLACLEVLMNVGNQADVMRYLRQLSAQISKSQGNIEVFKQTRESVRSQASDQRSQHPNDSAIGIDELNKIEDIIVEDEETIEKDFLRVIKEAVEVHKVSSVKAYSSAHSESTMSESAKAELAKDDPFVASQYNRRRQPSFPISPSSMSIAPEDPIRADPTPEFDDTTHIEPLEALIARLSMQAKDDMHRERYNQAERNHREAISLLEERHIGHGKPFSEFEDYQTTLADILGKLQHHDQARQIRHNLLKGDFEFEPSHRSLDVKPFTDMFQDPVRALKSSQQYHSLANDHFQLYLYNKEHEMDTEGLLEIAERDAKRAFKLRLYFSSKSDPKFLETVDLLLSIYDAQGKTIYHDVYFALYIGSRPVLSPQPAVSSPSLSSVSPRSSMSRVDSVPPGAPLRPSTTMSSDHADLAPWSTRSDSFQGDPLYGTYSCVAGATDETRIHLDPRAAKKDLRIAVRRNDLRTVSTLLERSGQPEYLVKLALHEATRAGKDQIVKLLVKDKDVKPDLMGDSKECALHIAARHGHQNILQLLLDANANINLAGTDGWTAIHFAIHGNHEHILLHLLNYPRKAAVDARNTYGDTGLHAAAERGEFRLASILIRAHATLSAVNNGGFTPLEVAIEKRNEKFVRDWINAGYPTEVDWDRCSSTSPHIRTIVSRHNSGIAYSDSEDSLRGSPGTSPRSPTSISFASPTSASRPRHGDTIGSMASASSGKRRSISRMLLRK
ncbi:Ankyrin repeat-containing protein 31 [Elsinoe fawcettii]|nr:Ankyrin repeat-containing protein 31 [Elsinoe fawcettii]